MTGKYPRGRWAIIFICFILGSASSGLGGDAAKPKRAPLNPEFVKYRQELAFGRSLPRTADGHALGDVPLPFLPSGVRPEARDRIRPDALPASYDLRLVGGKLPPVRDQGNCGSCWAFATYGSLESFLRPAESLDLSEQHLIDNAGFWYGPCDGGNIVMSTAYLARWAGPIGEADDPYVYMAAYPDGATPVSKHVQAVAYLPERASSLDNDLIKSHVQGQWVLYVSMYWVDSGYNAAHASFYNNGVTSGGGGHAVCIVGWDDDYPAANFNVAPPGNGAFIVRNSWGSSWGDGGYFYVSYYDTKFARRGYNAVVKAEAVNNYSGVFQYDTLGLCTQWGSGTDTGWAANVFTAPTKTVISAVGTYAVSPGAFITAYVYTGPTSTNPRAGTLRTTAGALADLAGYYTIPITPVTVLAGQRFSVVIKYRTPGTNFPVPAEEKLTYYSEAATAHAGESFISTDGAFWIDYMKVPAYAPYMLNFCIKAFTSPLPTLSVTSPAAGAKWMRGTTQTIVWTGTGAQADTVRIQLYQGTTKVADLAASTENDGSFDWAIPARQAPRTDYSIRVTTTDGKVKGTSAKFAIVKPTLTVTDPAAGAVWTRGTTRTVLWTKNGPQDANVRVLLFRNGVLLKELTPSTPNEGTYDWAIAATLPKGTGYKVRVKTLDGLVKDDSGLFTLR